MISLAICSPLPPDLERGVLGSSPRLLPGSPLSPFPVLPSTLPSSGPQPPKAGFRNMTAQIHQLEDAAKQHPQTFTP